MEICFSWGWKPVASVLDLAIRHIPLCLHNILKHWDMPCEKSDFMLLSNDPATLCLHNCPTAVDWSWVSAVPCTLDMISPVYPGLLHLPLPIFSACFYLLGPHRQLYFQLLFHSSWSYCTIFSCLSFKTILIPSPP